MIKKNTTTTVGHEYTAPCCEIVHVTHERNVMESSGMDDIIDEDLPWNLAPEMPMLPSIF